MVNYSKFSVLILFFVFSCTEQPESLPELNVSKSAEEQLLIGTWVYESVEAKGIEYLFANSRMELGNNRNALGGNRADLFRRQIVYFDNGTYQLKWAERGDYSLGTNGEDNWQPNFGSWELNGDILTHNAGFYYETQYMISISESKFARTSDRQMLEANQGAFWAVGEIVMQKENFRRIR